MILFILVAAAMTLFALALMLPVLWRKSSSAVADLEQTNISIAQEQLAQLDAMQAAGELNQAEYDERRNELELNLAASMVTTPGSAPGSSASMGSQGYIVSLVVGVLVPAGAFFLYQALGTPAALNPEYVAARQAAQLATQQAAQQAANGNVQAIEELLPRLETHLASNPDDLQGWRLLGVTYLRMQRFTDADSALGNALALSPGDPDILLQLADAKAMMAGGQLAGAPEALVRQALAARPDDVRGLWLLGMTQSQKNEHEAALETWQRLEPMVRDEPEAAREVALLINESRVALGLEPDSGQDAGKSAAAIVVEVSLDPAIAGQLDPDQRVYVYAKAVKGPPMPLAVVQHAVSELPLQVTLDDSLAMVAGMNLSGFEQVVVGARVSLTGNPVASSGDFYAEVQPVDVNADEPVTLTILDTVP